MSVILKKIESSIQQKKPFVCYRKPNSEQVSGFFQKNDILYTTDNFFESGFVFAPFDAREKVILIPSNFSEFISELIDLPEKNIKRNKNPTKNISKDNHIALVEKAIAEIKQDHFQKVVVSRKEEVFIGVFTTSDTFKNLLIKYPKAMVSIWYHPKIGLWFGATPETLLKTKQNTFETMSLAGTQVYQKDTNIVWGTKELNEQQLVTNFIASELKKVAKKVLIGERETVKAGSLLHLRTKVFGEMSLAENSLKLLLNALHPTPAVCGLPREITKQFILAHEHYNRKFYTGFLGEINIGNTSELFVNLRCMEVHEHVANIYVGGGITKESDPENEWLETVAKSDTIKQIL